MTAIETIQVDEGTRILVYVDEDSEDPRTWGEEITDDDPAVEAWRAGEVYGVAVERLETWTRTDSDGMFHKRTVWEETDSIWGCYLDETYTARHVAFEYFDVPIPSKD